MAKEARAKYKEESITELKEGIESLRVSIDYRRLLAKDSTDTPLSSELEIK